MWLSHTTLMIRFSPAAVLCIYTLIMSFKNYQICLQILLLSRMEPHNISGEQFKTYLIKKCQNHRLNGDVPWIVQLAYQTLPVWTPSFEFLSKIKFSGLRAQVWPVENFRERQQLEIYSQMCFKMFDKTWKTTSSLW